jgi:hypothetical protein
VIDVGMKGASDERCYSNDPIMPGKSSGGCGKPLFQKQTIVKVRKYLLEVLYFSKQTTPLCFPQKEERYDRNS